MQNVRKLENFHILLWLLKDLCWVLGLEPLGVIMITPTVLVAMYITFKLRHNHTELFHNLAVVCWIIANSIWMIGELYFDDTTRPPAIVFFVLGIGFVSFYYLMLLGKKVFKSKK